MILPELTHKTVLIDVMLFFASNAACWLTGQLVYVGGGWRMGM